jgi:hypothetical protein
MPQPSDPDPIIVAHYVRRYSLDELEDAIGEVSQAFLTSSITTVTALGITTGSDPAQTTLVLATLEAARSAKLLAADPTGTTAATALDATPPMSHGLDFSRRCME